MHSQAISSVAGAQLICDAFTRWSNEFHALTENARSRFERREWQGAQQDSVSRLALYERLVKQCVSLLRLQLGDSEVSREKWSQIKDAFHNKVKKRNDVELALTFFSSVARRLFNTVGVDPEIEFLDKPNVSVSTEFVVRKFKRTESIVELLAQLFSTYSFSVPYENIERDTLLVAGEIKRKVAEETIEGLEVAVPLFFRNKAAYLVGQLITTQGRMPFILPFLNDAKRDGVTIDAVLLTEDDASTVFSFTRSYFSARPVITPRELVAFLQLVMPRKPVSDLYISIGYHKRAKTELYRSLLHRLDTTEEKFDFAPGARGMVMIVFNMPSADFVFKVLRDQFDYPKLITRQEVMAKYQFVFEHDRAGRLIDAQEFTYLEFERQRFSEQLLEELRLNATESVEVREESVVVRHLYTERYVTPLDVYLREVGTELAIQAVLDYGAAVRDLAATGVFPGDLLLKNFGVTRHGRVVFYDYDEIAMITDCRFRRLPKPRDMHEELSAVPWFAVNEGDVFPEEFQSFLGLTGELRNKFISVHGCLLDVDFWVQMQEELRAGTLIDVFPYSSDKHLLASEREQSANFPEGLTKYA